jgi:hypothetical protein
MKKITLTLGILALFAWVLTMPGEANYAQGMNVLKQRIHVFYDRTGTLPTSIEDLAQDDPLFELSDFNVTILGYSLEPVIISTNETFQIIRIQGIMDQENFGDACQAIKVRTALNMKNAKLVDCTAFTKLDEKSGVKDAARDPLFQFTINVMMTRPDMVDNPNAVQI